MADTKVKRSILPAQPKRRPLTARTISAEVQTSPEAYCTLASMNECLKTVSDGLDMLQAAELIAPRASELRKAAAEELRADINATVTINMHTREMHAASYYQKERIKLEKRES